VTQRRRRIYHVRGEVRGADGRVVAEAEGRFLGASPTEKAQLKERYSRPPEADPGSTASTLPNATNTTAATR
jgi:hypothetical protein